MTLQSILPFVLLAAGAVNVVIGIAMRFSKSPFLPVERKVPWLMGAAGFLMGISELLRNNGHADAGDLLGMAVGLFLVGVGVWAILQRWARRL